jgi:hypothetical protein
MAFCELALKASDSCVHPGMNKRSRWFDDNRDLIVVLVAEPIEGHWATSLALNIIRTSA